MKSKNINTLLVRHILGTLTAAEQKALVAWLKESDANRQRYEALMHNTDLATRLRQYNRIDKAKAWKNFRNTHFKTEKTSNGKLFTLLPYVAAAIAVFLIMVGLQKYFQHPQPVVAEFTPAEKILIAKSKKTGKTGACLKKPDGRTVMLTPQIQQMLSQGKPLPKEFFDNAESEATLLTQNGQEFWMTLEDGTRVHLNYNSTLRYPEHFTAHSRTVYLEGEAFFDVAPNSHRPFYVHTPNSTIREYGTSFNVNTMARKGVTQVALVEGSISVMGKNGKEHMMKPGQLACIQSHTDSISIVTTDIQPYISWNTGEFLFDGCQLSKLMEVLSCWYNMHVEFADKEAMHIEFSGSIDRYKSLQATLTAITFATGHEITVTGNRIVIK